MASIVSFANVHQLSTSDKKPKFSPAKGMLHSPDSTNTPGQTTVPIAAPRGRGRKANNTFVHVIPGQPVAVARRNARERNRVKQVNNGFSNLRQHIPFSARNKKMSKVETLRCAVEYIRSLQHLLIENGGYDGLLDAADLQNVSSSSPLSSLESGEEHSLLGMSTSDVMYEQQDPAAPTSSMVEDLYSAQLRGGVILQPTRLYSESEVVFEDVPPNPLMRHGSSSLSPGYSDRSSVNNSPATGATASEVTTTGFMGVFAAAAAGLDKPIFKKELEEGAATSEMMAALSWWELEQTRRGPHQQQQHAS